MKSIKNNNTTRSGGEFGAVDPQFEGYIMNNPNMDNPDSRLLIAILMNAIHDAVSSQSSRVIKDQAWAWLENDDGIINYCLSVVKIPRDRLLRKVSYMRENNINLKTIYEHNKRSK